MYFYGTTGVNKNGNLEIGGVDSVELTKEFGTPLYVYDVALMRERAGPLSRHLKNKILRLKLPMRVKLFLP